jgi:SdrD B-like domain
VIIMRKLLSLLVPAFLALALVSCSDDTATPPQSQNDGNIHGQIAGNDFEYDVTPGDPGSGPFVLRGRNLHYNDLDGALVVDLSVVNRGEVAQTEPIGLTFIRLDPDGVTVLNPDNNIHDDGAAILFHFANDDGFWTPGEASLPRTVEFGVDKGTAIAFVARLDLGAPVESGNISGRVWNDANKDGHMDDNEGGIPGTGVYLYQFSSTDENTPKLPFLTTQTDREGNYLFRGLNAGGYVVSIAPSTIDLFPTTPTEIHVLLVNDGASVSSYKNANFGAVPNHVPPPFVGQRVHVSGKFSPPASFVASEVEFPPCPDDTVPIPLVAADPPDPNPECIGVRLRGTITEVAISPDRTAIRVMATWVMLDPNLPAPANIGVGDRVDVHAHAAAVARTWLVDSIDAWASEHDELNGRYRKVSQPTPATSDKTPSQRGRNVERKTR